MLVVARSFDVAVDAMLLQNLNVNQRLTRGSLAGPVSANGFALDYRSVALLTLS